MAGFNQSYTNIASQFGMPLFGVAGLPAFTGNFFWVNEGNGSDGNTGGPQDPLKTLSQALTNCVAGNNDVVMFTGTIHTTAALAWNKNNTHLIGLTAASNNDRARISQTGSAVFTPLVNVTAQGCIFKNLGTFHGFDDASTQICWAEAGGRNYYSNVQFYGMGNATAAAQAGSRSLTVDGAGENLFEDCTVGLDTVLRATGTNASLEFLSNTPRNVFRRAIFQMLTSNAADVHITVGAAGMDRYAFFDECAFLNAIESTGTTINAAITANAAAGGAIILRRPISLGATAIATTGPVYADSGALGPTTYGIAVKQT